MTKRLAIIGAGSSGLVSLKNAIDELPDWEIVCLEKSDNVRGCWGSPYEGFVSTTTKYTTQFACFRKFDASVHPDGGLSRSEFFCDGEYGDYLESFANEFDLLHRIQFNCEIQKIERCESASAWTLTWAKVANFTEESITQQFDAVILATGLAANAKSINTTTPALTSNELKSPEKLNSITGKCIVVFGGGESAVDTARRLADKALGNQVYLSLRSGIRVSPRYHPIRGVPSDFLRNRLMLSIHHDLRNWIGQRFVNARIKYKSLFERLFPSGKRAVSKGNDVAKRDWALRLNKRAKDDLFAMFHNKSDDFLDYVACGQIKPIGAPVNETNEQFQAFDSDDSVVEIKPDFVVPAIGYRSGLQTISNGHIREQDFHLGCCHVTYPDLFLIGFARPVIGNIPTISEMQARYVCRLIANKIKRPSDVIQQHHNDQLELKKRFGSLDLCSVYPVEMFPYCDRLAKQTGSYPSVRAAGGIIRWWRKQLEPATTLYYLTNSAEASSKQDSPPVYLPVSLTLILLMLKPLDAVYRFARSSR